MNRGQFGSLILNILFWLVVIGLMIWIIKVWIVDAGLHALGPLDAVKP